MSDELGDAAAAALTTQYVGEIHGHFFVPAYQRGYRWGEPEVRRLLEDVQQSHGEPYFLQPIVVKPRPDDSWELIDGQQRLTTLFLILSYIGTHMPAARPRYSLEYETRPQSQAYLRSLDPELQHTNIDYFHMYQAFQCVQRWFEGQPNELQAAIDLYTATSRSLQIIWYQPPDELDSKELFRRLNVGRIPLTDAELVKALLLARTRGQDIESDRVHQLASQWDVIERDLRRPELGAFITNSPASRPTHIELLLDILADGIVKPPPGVRPRFHTFETLRPAIEASPKAVWDDIQDLHARLLGWFEDRTLYHWVGYLVATGDRLGAILELTTCLTRSEQEAALKQRIRERLNLTANDLRDLAYPAPKCSEVLLLMNVETIRRRAGSSERYSFKEHAAGRWSLEHLHAQNADALKTADQWLEWLRRHEEALAALASGNEELDLLTADIRHVLQAGAVTESRFRQLEQRTVRALTSDGIDAQDEMHSIANLALLSSEANSALSNSVFEVKRREVINMDMRGDYIPACTRDAFLKYYLGADAHQIHFWGPQDRRAYLDAMVDIVSGFLLAGSPS